MTTDDGMSRKQEEQRLAEAAQRGDKAAWHSLYDRTVHPLFAFIHRRVRTNEEAEEIVQETYLTAIDALRRFDPEKGSFFAWLCGIGWRKAQEQYRKSARIPKPASSVFMDPDDFTRKLEDGTLPEDALMTEEVQDLIGATLTELTAEQCEILTAKYVRGETVETIAARAGKSEKAIESALTRARQAFRERFSRLAADYVPPETHRSNH